MHRFAGWVLAGGKSVRLGTDKALVEVDGEPLAVRTARLVQDAVGVVALIGGRDRLRALEFEAIDDSEPDNGPLGGILTALELRRAEWNLICACDLPFLDAAFLTTLVEAASASSADAVVPRPPEGKAQPLCAIYRISALERLRTSYQAGNRAVWRATESIQVQWLPTTDDHWTFNLNTPQDLNRLHRQTTHAR